MSDWERIMLRLELAMLAIKVGTTDRPKSVDIAAIRKLQEEAEHLLKEDVSHEQQ